MAAGLVGDLRSCAAGPLPLLDDGVQNLSPRDLTPPFALLAPGFVEPDRDQAHGPWLLLEGLREAPSGTGPVLWLAPSEGPARRLSAARARWVSLSLPEPVPLGVDLDEAGAAEAIEAIREAIAAGDVYQVNYTLRAKVGLAAGELVLAALCRAGVPRFAAWVHLGPEEHVSASPERFFSLSASVLRAEPMKGTAAPQAEAALLASEKEAAELAMIVDLTRDDLHGLCLPGSVQVEAARVVRRLPYALQTVGLVAGKPRPGLTCADVLAAMHPCGSVTGAPRPAARAHLERLERGPRGLYCGAIGLEAGEHATFSVAIRTASRQPDGGWVYGVGSGITYASRAAEELAEVRLKLKALAP